MQPPNITDENDTSHSKRSRQDYKHSRQSNKENEPRKHVEKKHNESAKRESRKKFNGVSSIQNKGSDVTPRMSFGMNESKNHYASKSEYQTQNARNYNNLRSALMNRS